VSSGGLTSQEVIQSELSLDMPEFRFQEGYPFASTGVHFVGPLFVSTWSGKLHDYRDAIVFEKFCFQISLHKETKIRGFHIPPV